MNEHLKQLQQWLNEQHLDVVYISDPTNIQYFTGFYSDPEERILALFVFPDHEPFLFTPALEVDAVKQTDWPYPVYGYLDHEKPFSLIADHIKQINHHPQFWGIEKDNLSVDRYEAIKQQFPTATFPCNVSRFIEKQKLIKTPEEIKTMTIAGQEADYAFEVGFNALQNGRSEQRIVAEIEYALMKKGVMEMSFDTIVQAGVDAADPHGGPKATSLIKPNELVLFDLGTVYHGYMSDATRTVAYGKPNDKALEIYQVCLEAQQTAQAAVKPGITAAELDKIARDIITKAGYGDYFIHRLGHGIGTSTHEFPSIMAGNDLIIKPGMCFSIEPGIYIPGVAGVRIEDCVHVTDNGCEPFTHTSKELHYIDIK